jgi:hypothetical protein
MARVKGSCAFASIGSSSRGLRASCGYDGWRKLSGRDGQGEREDGKEEKGLLKAKRDR